jgi:hypothetical protein
MTPRMAVPQFIANDRGSRTSASSVSIVRSHAGVETDETEG